jgi:hypothetical protein
MALTPTEALAVGAAFTALQRGTIPVRRPSYTRPPMWSRPLTITSAAPIVGGGGWVDVLVVPPIVSYRAVVKSYIATTQVGQAVSGVDFRFMLDAAFVDTVQIGAGTEISKDAPSTYPCVWRNVFFFLTDRQTLRLQARNNSVFARTVLAGVYGWYADSAHDSSEQNSGVIADTGAQYG